MGGDPVTLPPLAETYCGIAPGDPWHGPYHEREYGFPVHDESALFERLILEINQAGLSWLTILKKRDGLRAAYAGFDVDSVARFDSEDAVRLLGDPAIIRNRRKIAAAIENAHRIVTLRESHGGFAAWLDAQRPRDAEDWIRLFRRTFVFTGDEITRAFLMSVGYLPGAHHPDCPVHVRTQLAGAPWAKRQTKK